VRSRYYILDGHTPVPVDVITWGQWFAVTERHVADDADEGTGVRVSTVFLGLDHSFRDTGGGGPPVLFETLVFADSHPEWDGRTERYATWNEALAGHRAVVAEIRAALGERA